MSLPIFISTSRELSSLQTNWAQILNPVIDLPINSGLIRKNISLASGDNTINHLLGRKLQGWFIVRQRASATFFDKQDTNNSPSLTLVLNASGAVSVDIFVF